MDIEDTYIEDVEQWVDEERRMLALDYALNLTRLENFSGWATTDTVIAIAKVFEDYIKNGVIKV